MLIRRFAAFFFYWENCLPGSPGQESLRKIDGIEADDLAVLS